MKTPRSSAKSRGELKPEVEIENPILICMKRDYVVRASRSRNE
ncbi:hypothetical protein Cal7507_4019 [Calothrix sp. PCC 7507]|nr:hypothetical protein Cal7507_4019 [Calothrix sp. PCC 7507]